MQVTINLTPEQVLSISTAVTNLDISEFQTDIVHNLMTDKGEAAELEAAKDSYAANWSIDGKPKTFTDLDYYQRNNFKYITLRQRARTLIAETIRDEALKEHHALIETMVTETGNVIKDKMPEILIQAQLSQFKKLIEASSNTDWLASGLGSLQGEVRGIKERLNMQ